jgi:hypothetical protein
VLILVLPVIKMCFVLVISELRDSVIIHDQS